MTRRSVLIVATVVLVTGLLVSLVGQAVEELAELHVTKIYLEPPSTVTRGEDVEIHARVMNTGQRSADSFSIGFFYRLQNVAGSWILLDTIEGVSLAPSQQDFLDVAYTLDTLDVELGTYEIRVVADVANQIPEVDELDNELVTTLTLVTSSLGLPDLQPVRVAHAPTNPASSDDILPWTVTALVRNQGEAQAGAFSVVFLVAGEEFGRKFLFALPADGSTEVVAELDPYALGLEHGTFPITVRVDADDQVNEQDEGNNTITSSLTLLSPELFPTALEFDKSIVHLDEEVRVSVEICNDGNGPAKGVEVSFYIDLVRFETKEIEFLGRGLTARVDGILDPEKLGLTDAPKVHEVRAVVDPNNLLNELDEANNTMTRTLTILRTTPRQPELHPESLELSPPSPAELGRSDAVTVSTVIKNTGRAAAEEFDIGFYYRVKGAVRWQPFPCSDDVSCSGLTLPSGSQAKLVGVVPILFLSPGIYEIRVVVDHTDLIAELDETNNGLTTTLTLLASRLPDLVFVPPLIVNPSQQVIKGQTVQVSARVTNIGDMDSGPFSVRFSRCTQVEAVDATTPTAACTELDEFKTTHFTPTSTVEVPGLAIGESTLVQVAVETNHDEAVGLNLIRADLDSDGKVRERDETNNILGTSFLVWGPDLTIAQFRTIPEGVIDTTETPTIEFVATVTNIGVVPAGAFNVGFQLLKLVDGSLVPVGVFECGADTPIDCRGQVYYATVPGIDVVVPVEVRCLADLSQLEPGEYIARVAADCEVDILGICGGTGNVREHVETNNFSERPIVLVGQAGNGNHDGHGADLTVHFVGATSTALHAVVTNRSAVGAGPFDVVFFEATSSPADPIYSERISWLAGGETTLVYANGGAFDVSAWPAGEYAIMVWVDPEDRILETNEANNTSRQTMSIP
jgi:subtilase family serine protease